MLNNMIQTSARVRTPQIEWADELQRRMPPARKIHYFHVRKWIEMPVVEDVNEFQLSERGGITFAAWEARDYPGCIEYTMAKCSKNDNFCRKVGRNIATVRLRSEKANKHYFTGTMDDFADYVHTEIKV